MWRIRWGFELGNFKYPTYKASQVIKSPPCPLPLVWGLTGDLNTSLADPVINTARPSEVIAFQEHAQSFVKLYRCR